VISIYEKQVKYISIIVPSMIMEYKFKPIFAVFIGDNEDHVCYGGDAEFTCTRVRQGDVCRCDENRICHPRTVSKQSPNRDLGTSSPLPQGNKVMFI